MACVRIEQISVEAQTEIMSAGISSDEGWTFLARLPAVEDLMPPLEMDRVQALLEHRSERRRLLDGSDDD